MRSPLSKSLVRRGAAARVPVALRPAAGLDAVIGLLRIGGAQAFREHL
jgi:hypothetical protein